MIDNKKWIKFDLNSEIAPTENFEIWFCKEFFAIDQWINLDQVKIIEWARWIENEPINWVSFQSKYIKKWWDWSQIESSLNKILDSHTKYYPNLKKVIVYVKKIWSDKYLEEKNKVDWILQKLKNIWVDVDIYSDWEKIWTDNKYESLRDYFEIKQDVNNELKLIGKYIENLYLDLANDNLNILEEKLDSLDSVHKYEYYINHWKSIQYNNYYKEEWKLENTDYCEDFINASKYNNNWKSLLNKAVWLYWKWDKQTSKNILKEIYKNDEFNNKIYWFYLITHSDEYAIFDDLLNDFDIKYKDDIYVKWILWKLGIEKWLKLIDIFDLYFRQKWKDINLLTEKITYFQIWRDFLTKKYWFNNLSKEAKNEYIEIEKFISSFEKDLEWKKLFVEIDILNFRAVINSKIIKNYDIANYYFDKALEKKDSWIVRLNKILSLLNKKWEFWYNIIESLEIIVNNFDFYINDLNEGNDWNILYQAHILLAQEYFFESQKLRKNWYLDKSDVLKNKWLDVLKNFRIKYYNNLDILNKRNFWIWDIQFQEEKSIEKVLSYIEEDNCIIYNLLAYRFLSENKYIENSYELYKNWEKESIESLINLANILLYDLWDEKRFFEIINNELNDLSEDENLFINYIISWINLWEVKDVENKLDEYKNINWENYIYIKYKAYLEERRQNIKWAIEIIENYAEKEEYIDLLFWKSTFEYNSWNNKYIETLKKIYELWVKNNFNNFTISDKLNFVSSYWLVNIEETIKLCYKFLQDKNISRINLIELKKIYFGLFIKLKWNPFLEKGINEDTFIKVKNIKNNDEITILLDWYSNEKYVNHVFNSKDSEYKKLDWKVRWDSIINLFNNEPIFWVDNEYKIIEIQNKYIYLHQLNMNKPEELGIIKIQVQENNWETDFTNLFDILNKTWIQEKEKKKYIDENFVKKWLLTFWVLKYFYWKSYIDYYFQTDYKILKSDQEFKIDISENIENLVLDPSSIISVFELWLDDIIVKKFNLFISQSTFSYFNNELTDVYLEPKSEMTIYSDWDWNHSKIEIPKDFYWNRSRYLEKIKNWLDLNCKIESSDLLVRKKEWIDDILWKEFYDSLLLAKDKWYYLVSDDQVLRNFAKNKDNKVRAFWSEILLIYLSSQNIVNPSFLIDSYLKLIRLNFVWLLINSWLLNTLLIKENLEELELVISYVKNIFNDVNFLVWSLIHSILQINKFKWNIWWIDFKFNDDAKIHYFNIYYKILIKYYSKEEIKSVFYDLVYKLENKDDTDILLSLLN